MLMTRQFNAFTDMALLAPGKLNTTLVGEVAISRLYIEL